jgi:hypothetical protein
MKLQVAMPRNENTEKNQNADPFKFIIYSRRAACWDEIAKDPDSTTKFCWGQTYRQWSSFMKTSVIAEALKSHVHLYFAHGTADTQQTIAGFDVLRAELAARQRDAVFERIEGADHALDFPNQKVPEGLEAVFGWVVDWFLGNGTK